MSRNRWYEIKNVSDASAEVFIYDEIGWEVSASGFIRELKALTGKSLTVRIHSPGGSVLEGHAIYNALLRHNGGVTVQIDGLAASMAGVIAMVGKPVRMAENAFLMIHNPSGGVFGTAEDMRKQADLIDKMRDGLVNIFVQRTGKSAEEIEQVMDAETWFSAQEAKDFGLIDEVTDKLELAASFDLTKFRNAPRVDTQRGADMADTDISAQLATVTQERDIARAQAQKNFQDFQAIEKERDALNIKLGEVNEQLSARTGEITNLNAQLAKAAQDFQAYKDAEVQRINAAATNVAAAAGHTAVAQTKEDTQFGQKTISRADFNKLASKAQSDFCRTGGRITD